MKNTDNLLTFWVVTRWRSIAGNCLTARNNIKAVNGLIAIDIAAAKIRKRKNFERIDSNSATLINK